MITFLLFIIFGLLVVALIVWLVLNDRRSKAARSRKLSQIGFLPCTSEAETLADKVTWLENNAEYRYSAQNPMRASLHGKTVYYYNKSRRRQGHIVETDEFLIPLTRPSSEGLMLFVKPSNLAEGTATQLIGTVATGAWDSQPDDLTKLEIPIELKGSNILGALGPSGASLNDLIDSAALALMQQVGDAGVLIVTCRGEWCSLASPSGRMKLDLDKLLPIIRRFA